MMRKAQSNSVHASADKKEVRYYIHRVCSTFLFVLFSAVHIASPYLYKRPHTEAADTHTNTHTDGLTSGSPCAPSPWDTAGL